MTQESLAAVSGISRNTISNLERNEGNSGIPADPVFSTIYRLAQALNVPPAALIPAVGEPVKAICSDRNLEVDVVWPDTEIERILFEIPDHSDDELPVLSNPDAHTRDIPRLPRTEEE